MLVRRLIFGLLLIVLLSVAWSVYRKAGDAARQRDALRAIPLRIADLNLPLSQAWETTLKLPGDATVLRPLGLPDKVLGPQPDGSEINLHENGRVEVVLKMTGNDKRAARLTWIPLVDLQAQPPLTRIHEWRCFSDNFPEVAQLLPACRFVGVPEYNAELAEHLTRLDRAVNTVRPPTQAEAEASSSNANGIATPAVPTPGVALTPEEVEKALRSGQSLEQALAIKRGTTTPLDTPSTPPAAVTGSPAGAVPVPGPR